MRFTSHLTQSNLIWTIIEGAEKDSWGDSALTKSPASPLRATRSTLRYVPPL